MEEIDLYAPKIDNITVKNFKKYNNQVFDLNDQFIVLIGPNSAGKSTLIKAMLAFKQTWEDQRNHTGFLSNGNYVDVGLYSDYVFNHIVKRNCSFSFTMKLSNIPRPRGIIFSSLSARQYATVTLTQERDPQSDHGRLAECEIQFHDDSFESIRSGDFIRYFRMNKAEESYKVEMSRSLFDLLVEAQSIVERRSAPRQYDYGRLRDALRTGAYQARRTPPVGFRGTYVRGSFFPEYLLLNRAEIQLDRIFQYLRNDLTAGTFAIGALRSIPGRGEARSDESSVVGARGENVASVFSDFRMRALKAGKRRSHVRANFEKLLNWFSELQLADSVSTETWKSVVNLSVKYKSHTDSIADLGVGFSQAFPVLVQLASMPDTGRILLEQPELHLYPWAQTELGKILAKEVGQSGKQIIVETHSEHLILGIQEQIARRRVYGEHESVRHDRVKVIYVDRDGSHNEMGLKENGDFVEEWPEGFFGQGLLSISERMRLNNLD